MPRGNTVKCLTMSCLAVLVIVCACGESDDIRPSQYYVFSFEGSMQGWSTNGTDLDNPSVVWYIQRAVDMSRDSVSSAKLYLENVNDKAKIWMERAFEVDSSADYRVTVRYSFATRDWGQANLWNILTGVSPRPVSMPEELGYQGSTGTGTSSDVGYVWTAKSYDFDARSSSSGRLYVHIGVWGTWETTRVYYVDLVSVSFTRR